MKTRAIVRSESMPSVVTGVAAHRVLDRWEAMGLPVDSSPPIMGGDAPIDQMQDLAEKLYGQRPPAELVARLWAENTLDVIVPSVPMSNAPKSWLQRQCERWAVYQHSLLWHMGPESREWRKAEIKYATLSKATALRRAALMGVAAAIGFCFSGPLGWLFVSLAVCSSTWALHHAAISRGIAGWVDPTDRAGDHLCGFWLLATESVASRRAGMDRDHAIT